MKKTESELIEGYSANASSGNVCNKLQSGLPNGIAIEIESACNVSRRTLQGLINQQVGGLHYLDVGTDETINTCSDFPYNNETRFRIDAQDVEKAVKVADIIGSVSQADYESGIHVHRNAFDFASANPSTIRGCLKVGKRLLREISEMLRFRNAMFSITFK